MILDVYYNPELTKAIGIIKWFILFGPPLLCVTILTTNKYKLIPKTNIKKRKKMKITAIIFGIMTLICVVGFIYFYCFSIPKIAERYDRDREPWLPADRDEFQSSDEESEQ